VEPTDIEALERDVVVAVAPSRMLEIEGWLAPLDEGTIGRARSAVPLHHDVGPEAIGAIAQAYGDHGLAPRFRIADVAGLAPVRAELARRGNAAHQPTIFETGRAEDMSVFSDPSARLLDRPDKAWAGVFLGEGFDPVDGAHRVVALSRSPGAVYGAAGEGGATWAVGVMSFGRRWAGVHGMRTAPAHRGRGYAGAILAAFGREARRRGFDRVFLQVEEANPAERLYARAGFAPIWRYHYWR
jgi:GNAT superfamily N-acetyltransferase